jgi:hypothetical protein
MFISHDQNAGTYRGEEKCIHILGWERGHLEHPDIYIRKIFKMILKSRDGMVWSGFIWLRTWPGNINKHSVSTKRREFLD